VKWENVDINQYRDMHTATELSSAEFNE